ncbi:hypothetical protein B0H12DRAFT_1240100 [Mycena haematopus]|nr:hypothetical protein B0H12DRAFT_1240100 [Mycena haematopus]
MTGKKTPRKATTTAKAKKAAEIAAAEGKDDEYAPSVPRKRGRPPKVKPMATDPPPKKTVVDSDEDDDVDIIEGDGAKKATEGVGTIEIDWNNDTALTWTLISAIEDDDDTRRSLFPPPGSTKRNGGLPKKHFHYVVAEKCFGEHPTYQEVFKKAVKPKDKKDWGNKIKNRLKVLVDKTRAQIEMMGETGAGVEAEVEILPGTTLMTKWDEIKQDSPWFWEIRSLIGERPNLQPVGIGNNDDEMDVSLLIQSDGNDQPSSPDADTSDLPEPAHLLDNIGGPVLSLDDDSDDEPAPKRKKAATPNLTAKKAAIPNPTARKTKPQPAISAPAVKSGSTKAAKPTTAKDKFTAVVVAEEETEQARLVLKKEKATARQSVEMAKIEGMVKVKIAKAKVKGEEKIARLQLARVKMEQEHQFRMAQYGQQSSHAGAVGRKSFFDDESFSFHNTPSLGPSDAGSSSASTPFGLDTDLQLSNTYLY